MCEVISKHTRHMPSSLPVFSSCLYSDTNSSLLRHALTDGHLLYSRTFAMTVSSLSLVSLCSWVLATHSLKVDLPSCRLPVLSCLRYTDMYTRLHYADWRFVQCDLGFSDLICLHVGARYMYMCRPNFEDFLPMALSIRMRLAYGHKR